MLGISKYSYFCKLISMSFMCSGILPSEHNSHFILQIKFWFLSCRVQRWHGHQRSVAFMALIYIFKSSVKLELDYIGPITMKKRTNICLNLWQNGQLLLFIRLTRLFHMILSITSQRYRVFILPAVLKHYEKNSNILYKGSYSHAWLFYFDQRKTCTCMILFPINN